MSMEPIDVEVIDHVVPAKLPTSSLISLAAPVTEIVAAQNAYHEVCAALLDDNDVQVIGKKVFKKRSAWNKLAVAFAVSTEEIRTTHERDERGRIIRTECVVRATAPNGRVSDGIGAADLYEKCCDPRTCTKRTHWEESGKPTGHVHCTETPCRTAHFSNSQHDIPATAFTRASNRAKADLFGMGEVSAEEVSGSNHQYDDAPDQPSAPRNQSSQARMISDGQIKLIGAVSTKLNYGSPEDAVKKFLGAPRPPEQLTMTEARKVIDGLKAEEAGGPVDAGEPF